MKISNNVLQGTETQDNFTNVGKTLFNATHAILFQAINADGKTKQAVLFVNCTDDWYKHFFSKHPQNDFHKLDHINAYASEFLRKDESIIASKTTAYKLNNPLWCINWATKVNPKYKANAKE